MSNKTKMQGLFFDEEQTGGRPIKKLNDAGLEMVQNLASIMCTEEEIASVLCVTVEVLHNRLNKDIFLEAIVLGKEKGKASLRRTQFDLAKHSASMAIWLGKQYLAQRDILESELKVSKKDDDAEMLRDYLDKMKQ